MIFTPKFSTALAASLVLSLPAAAATLTPKDGGIEIDAGKLGSSLLEYPQLSKKDNGNYKIVEKNIDGKTAVLKYDGGGQITVDASDPSKIVLNYEGLPTDTKGVKLNMRIGYGVGPDRKWKFDEANGIFPPDKPAKPHLYQNHAKTFSVINYENRVISFTLPPNVYNELTDAREWGWNAVFWKATWPYNKDWKSSTIGITDGMAGELKKVTLIDKFGQPTTAEWTGKVATEEELKADVESEKTWLASLNPPATTKYGGIPGSGAKLGLKATGYFHVEKKKDRWYLVEPEGNAFFHLGVCAVGPVDDYTQVQGREQIYESIPSTAGVFKTAFRPGSGSNVLSFHLANRIRKFNEPYDINNYTAHMIERLKKWGFNSVGAFSQASGNPSAKAANFPYVSGLPLGQWDAKIMPIPGITSTWDPFDAGNLEKMDAAFAKSLTAKANDPLIIGYFLTNEPIYEDIPKVVPTLKGTFACKRRLVQMLQEKYKSVDAFNTAWDLKLGSFEEMNDAGLAVKTRTASEDMQAYQALFFDTYFKAVSEAARKYDPNHMLIGNRLQSGTINNEALCRAMGKYLDVVSFNYYTYGFDKAFLTRIHSWTGGKPMFLSEFYWTAPKESGLRGGSDVGSQKMRGEAYRNYVEAAAATGFVVGIEWFTMVDQSATGRWFSGYNGESNNTGLVSVTDRPYRDMLTEMIKTNYNILPVWTGEKKPFVLDEPRFTMASGAKRNVNIARATGPIKLDGTTNNWPGVPAETISSARLVQGGEAKGVEASFKLCWDDQNLYLLTNVVDATPMKNEMEPSKLWSGDGIELFIGSEKVGDGGPLLFTDRQLLIGAGKNNQFYLANAPDQVAIQSVVVPGVDGKSYTLQAAIPWEALAIKPVAGKELAFDLAIDDGPDGRRRERQLMWNGTAKNSGERGGWGKATLVR